MDWETFEPDPVDVEEFGDLAYSAAYSVACSWFSSFEEVNDVPDLFHDA